MRRPVSSGAAAIVLCALACGSTASTQDQAAGCSQHDLESARFVFHRAWFEEADGRFGLYLGNCPDDPFANAYVSVIDMLLYRDVSDHASHALRSAAAVNDTDALFVSAIVSFAESRLEDAEQHLRQYRQVRPADRYASHFLGFTLIDQGRYDDGVQVLTDLLGDDPDYFPAKNHLAYGLLKKGEADEAIRIVREFVAADPGNPSAWDTQADILHSLDRSEEAIASLARGVLLDDRFAYGFRHMGNILASVGDDDAARAAYEKAVDGADLYGPDFSESVRQLLSELDGD